MPFLLRRMARTAVIAGTATAVAGGVARRQNQRYVEQDAAAKDQASEQSIDQTQDDVYVQLEKLGKLKDEGILTEAEFNAKKQQLLGL